MRDAAIAERRPAGAVADDDRMLRPADRLIVQRHALHQPDGIHALLITDTGEIVEGQAGQRHDRCAIEGGVVETIEQMDRTGSGRADTDAKPAGVLGKARRHEGRSFLMPHADIANAVGALAQRLDNGIDAVSDDATPS
jgi:hypothetical protein